MSCSSAGAAQLAQRGRSKPSTSPTATAISRHALGVAAGVGRLGVDDHGERLGDAVEAAHRRRSSTRSAGSKAPTACPARAASERPEAVVAAGRAAARRRAPGRTRCRGARARRRRRRAAPPRPPRRPRRSGRGRGCAPSSGIARRPGRTGSRAPSQCSSRLRIAWASGSVSPIMRAISAPRSQRSSVSPRAPSAAAAGDHRQARARWQRRVRARARSAVADAGPRWVVGELAVALERRGRRRRTAQLHAAALRRAAGVLEQQRVEERRARPRRRARAARRSACRSARALGVAARLALRDVERVGQRGDDLGEPDVHQTGIGADAARLDRRRGDRGAWRAG